MTFGLQSLRCRRTRGEAKVFPGSVACVRVSQLNDLLIALLVSGSLGALVGLERQWDEQLREQDARVPAGVRTFTLWGLFGALCGHFSNDAQSIVFAVGLLALAGWLGIYVARRSPGRAGAGLTTAASGVLVYLVGGLVEAGERQVAVIVTISLLILLASKGPLHALSKKFTREDVRVALQFLAVSGVVLPLLPDREMGPFGALNPRSVWMMVVMVSGLGFAGYCAIRVAGASLGLVLTGLAGGLASSTATMLGMSKLSKARPEDSRACALAAVLACTVMLWRIGFLVAVVHAPTFLDLWPTLAVMSVPGLMGSIIHWVRFRRGGARNAHEITQYDNPLGVRVAIQFAILYALVVLVVKATAAWLGGAGLIGVSFLSGMTDLDAISLSMADLSAKGGAAPAFAAGCIVVAATANTIVKLGMAMGFGSPQFRKEVTLLLGLTTVLGGATVPFLL